MAKPFLYIDSIAKEPGEALWFFRDSRFWDIFEKNDEMKRIISQHVVKNAAMICAFNDTNAVLYMAHFGLYLCEKQFPNASGTFQMAHCIWIASSVLDAHVFQNGRSKDWMTLLPWISSYFQDQDSWLPRKLGLEDYVKTLKVGPELENLFDPPPERYVTAAHRFLGQFQKNTFISNTERRSTGKRPRDDA
jgi:hypothetical protein